MEARVGSQKLSIVGLEECEMLAKALRRGCGTSVSTWCVLMRGCVAICVRWEPVALLFVSLSCVLIVARPYASSEVSRAVWLASSAARVCWIVSTSVCASSGSRRCQWWEREW